MQNERNRKTFEEITEQINRDNTISLNRPIAHAVGAYAAIVFNALIGKYIYYKQKNMLDRDGWFYSTIKDMKESTTLSRYHKLNPDAKPSPESLKVFKPAADALLY